MKNFIILLIFLHSIEVCVSIPKECESINHKTMSPFAASMCQLMISAESGNRESIHFLHQFKRFGRIHDLYGNNTSMDAKGGHSMTPLMNATANGNKDTVEMLIQDKADVNVKDEHG